MEIIIQKYQLAQGNKVYSLSTQASQEKLKLTCEDINVEHPSVYVCEFTLLELMQLTPLFASVSTIKQAQEIFENIIVNQKVRVESQGDYLILQIFVKKEDGGEEYFSLLLNLFNSNASDINGTSTQSMLYQQSFGNLQNIEGNLSNQYTSFMDNNNENGQIVSTPVNITSTQYSEIPQIESQTTETKNEVYNTTENNYNYANVQSHKTKKRRVDKLTLSLRAQPESISANDVISESLSPQVKKMSPVQNTPLFQKNVIETTTTTINKEHLAELDNLKDENERLRLEIIKLKGQIEILNLENQNLKFKNSSIQKYMPNGNNSQEITLKKEEIESYLNEMKSIRNELNDFEEYKKLKEKEINSYKIQIEELLINQNKIQEYNIQKQKEIDELKLFIDEQIRKQRMDESTFQQSLEKQDLEKDILSTQDMRLEIVKGDIIQNPQELELLTRRIDNNNSRIILDLLYKASIDSDKAEVFHKKCDFANSTLVLVRSGNGKRFGGYTTCSWKGNSIEKKDSNAFVFSLDKMKIYDVIPGEDAIGCYPKYGPIFLGCQIRIYDDFFTNGGTTFEKGLNYKTEEDYELTGGLNKFDVKDIEVYSVELE